MSDEGVLGKLDKSESKKSHTKVIFTKISAQKDSVHKKIV